mmetsp:Transcript_45/g.159  ORF Transcript_45/g.159 Transcript_45/m.159 type:complete len:121 (-) Transcript_45:386-748(-)
MPSKNGWKTVSRLKKADRKTFYFDRTGSQTANEHEIDLPIEQFMKAAADSKSTCFVFSLSLLNEFGQTGRTILEYAAHDSHASCMTQFSKTNKTKQNRQKNQSLTEAFTSNRTQESYSHE